MDQSYLLNLVRGGALESVSIKIDTKMLHNTRNNFSNRGVRSPSQVPAGIPPHRVHSAQKYSLSASHKPFLSRTSYSPRTLQKLNQTHSPFSSFIGYSNPNTKNVQHYSYPSPSSLSPVINSIPDTKNISTRMGEGSIPTTRPKGSSDVHNVRVIESVAINRQLFRPEFQNSPMVSESTVRQRTPIAAKSNKSIGRVSPTQLNPESETTLSTHDQYILQLLGESKEMKAIVERLIEDNTRLVEENRVCRKLKDDSEELKQLRKLLKHYQQEITELKMEAKEKKVERNVNDDSELEHYNRIINKLEQEVTNSRNAFEKPEGQKNVQELSKLRDNSQIKLLENVIGARNQQIVLLRQENSALSAKLREVLQEMHSMQLNFQTQKIHLIEQNESFKQASWQEISRLRELTRIGLEEKPHQLLQTIIHKYEEQHPEPPSQQPLIEQHLHISQHSNEPNPQIEIPTSQTDAEVLKTNEDCEQLDQQSTVVHEFPQSVL